MDENQIRETIEKYLSNQSTAEEDALLESWYLQQSTVHPRPDTVTIEKNEVIMLAFLQKNMARGRITRLWPRIAAVAASVLLIISTAILIHQKISVSETHVQRQISGIVPGSQGATLTLANGKKIILSQAANGEIAREQGVSIQKSAEGHLLYQTNDQKTQRSSTGINVLTTAKGQTFMLTLPDGSKVWLNAASEITYNPELLQQGKRLVSIKGEAYFEVAKDKHHPFIVESARQRIEVLGTHFNVSAYTNDRLTKTTLLEGSIKVASASYYTFKILRPDQQSLIGNSSELKVENVNTDFAVAWKNGYFSFDHENLESVMTKIARWYNIEVVFADKSVREQTFYGNFSRFEKFATVMKILERTDLVELKTSGNTVIISKKKSRVN